MNHRIKTFILKILERLPREFGDFTYHQIQKLFSKPMQLEYETQLDTINRFFRILEFNGLSFAGKRIVEIGSGWLPVLPYELVFKQKVMEVLTFDINAHYQSRSIARFNRLYSMLNNVYLGDNLPVNVRYFPRTNITEVTDLKQVDAMVSRNVLEHITPSDLKLIHQQAFTYLKSDGFIIHQISPSDHRAYTDPTLSLWDFLQYSQAEWDRIQTRFDYHNRWRLPQYIGLFKQCGFQIRYLSFKSARLGQRLPDLIHDDFKIFSEAELTAGNIIILLVKE